MSSSSSRTSRSTPDSRSRSNTERRLSYDEIKEMMIVAAQETKRKEEREKAAKARMEEENAVATNRVPCSVLAESALVNSNGADRELVGKTGRDLVEQLPEVMSAKVSKHDWKSVSCRQPRSKQINNKFGTTLTWNSREPPNEKWRSSHPGIIVEEQENVVVEQKKSTAVEEQKSQEVSSSSFKSESSSNRMAQSCRTKRKPSIDFTCLEERHASPATELVRRADNLSRTQAWLDEAADNQTSPVTKPSSPEIQEVELLSFERSALIEDQLPGRLSQSVRFIKQPGTPFVFPSKDEKKRSKSSFLAFSAKIASKLGRLFSSKSARVKPAGRGEHMSNSASSESSTDSPKKISSLRRWLHRPAASKVASAESDKPEEQDRMERTGSLRKGAGGQLDNRRKGKENVEVRHNFPPPLAAPFHADSRLSRTTSDSLLKPSALIAAAAASTPESNSKSPQQTRIKLERSSSSTIGLLLRQRQREDDLWSRAATSVTSENRISPQEYARSVLGSEQGLVKPLRFSRRVFVPAVSPGPVCNPVDDPNKQGTLNGEGTLTGPGSLKYTNSVASLANPEKDEDSTSTRVISRLSQDMRRQDMSVSRGKVDQDSAQDSAEDTRVIDMLDYIVFSSDGGLPSSGTSCSSKAGEEGATELPKLDELIEVADSASWSSVSPSHSDEESNNLLWSSLLDPRILQQSSADLEDGYGFDPNASSHLDISSGSKSTQYHIFDFDSRCQSQMIDRTHPNPSDHLRTENSSPPRIDEVFAPTAMLFYHPTSGTVSNAKQQQLQGWRDSTSRECLHELGS